MKAKSLIVAAAVAALYVPNAHSAPSPSRARHTGETAGVVRLPAVFQDDFVFVQTSINGGPSLWMLLDTGDEACSLDIKEAKRLKLNLISDTSAGRGFGTEQRQAFDTIASAKIGSASARNIKFEAYEFPQITAPDGRPVSGAIGYSFLVGRRLVIDYPNHRLYLIGSARPLGVRFRLEGNLPVVNVAIDGKPSRAVIDTGGSYGIILTPTAALKLGLKDYLDRATSNVGTGTSGDQAVRIGRIPRISVAGIETLNPPTVFTTFGTLPTSFDAAIGKMFLAGHILTIDYRSKTLRFDR